MGLDIAAYSRLTPAPGVDMDEGDNWQTHMRVLANPDFPGREAPLADGIYRFEESDGFAAGSYGWYNNWREWLAKLAGYPAIHDPGHRPHATHSTGAWKANEGPFWELICFADNEGTIGATAAAKLATEFADWEDRAVDAAKAEDDGDWYIEKYRDWRKAFELASDGGAVDFH